jgi:CheY-like chemotaxis protein
MSRSGFFSVDSLKGVHVLVVDDEALARDIVRDILEYCGALVMTVESAQAALDSMRLIKPDVLVAKLDLPGRDGVWLMTQVRSRKPEAGGEVPAIALGGEAGERERCLAGGFNVHFTWPLNPWEFTRSISSLITTGWRR